MVISNFNNKKKEPHMRLSLSKVTVSLLTVIFLFSASYTYAGLLVKSNGDQYLSN